MKNAACWKALRCPFLWVTCFRTPFIRVRDRTKHISGVSTNPEFLEEEVIFFLFLIPPSLQLFIQLVLIE